MRAASHLRAKETCLADGPPFGTCRNKEDKLEDLVLGPQIRR